MLDWKGNYNTRERIELLEKFTLLFVERKITCKVLINNFYDIHNWLKYPLSQPSIPFGIEIREIDLLGNEQHELSSRIIFSYLNLTFAKLLSFCLLRGSLQIDSKSSTIKSNT